MTWNYRIVRYSNGMGYGLHEVHYATDGNVISMTEHPAAFVGDSPEEVRGSLMMAKMDASRRPVLDELTAASAAGGVNTNEAIQRLKRACDIGYPSIDHGPREAALVVLAEVERLRAACRESASVLNNIMERRDDNIKGTAWGDIDNVRLDLAKAAEAAGGEGC